MVQPSTEENKPEITIGVLGQDGHGKTSLTAAITQYLSRRNGRVVAGGEMFMSAGRCTEEGGDPAEYETATRRYSQIDYRRHFDVLESLILNWLPLHGAILVVSALDGVTAQTRTQVDLARSVGVAAMVVFLTKCDLVTDSELLGVVELEVQELLARHGYPTDTPILRGSALAVPHDLDPDHEALWSSKIQELLDALDTTIPDPPNLNDMPFLMAIEDVFAITGRGTIVAGRVERGQLTNREPVEIVGLGPTRTAITADLEQFHEPRERIVSGDNAGILLRDLPRTELQRGQVLAAPGSMRAYTRFQAILYLLRRGGWGGGSDYYDLSDPTYAFLLRSTDINGALTWPERTTPLREGEAIRVTVTLETAAAMEPELRFRLRKGGYTLGYGVITEPLS